MLGKQKMIVFFCVHDKANQWAYFCDTEPFVEAVPNGKWVNLGLHVAPERSAAGLTDSMRFRGGTEYALVRFQQEPVEDWVVTYPGGFNQAIAAETGRQIAEWKKTHPAKPAGAAPALEPKKEEEITRCGFCEEEADPFLLTCKAHHSVAVTHSDRLRSGGLVDCPETRAESARFVARQCAEVASDKAALTGYRTPLDHGARAKHPSLQEQKLAAAPGAIASAGQTPHYEWP